jgi:hypothetical protein
MVSAANLMINKSKIWNWQFFGDHLKESNPPLYEDLIKLEKLWIKKIITIIEGYHRGLCVML